MSIQEFVSLLNGVCFKLINGMQRETRYTTLGSDIITHVDYDDEKAREIGEKFGRNEYWNEDEIKLFLLSDGEEQWIYQADEEQLRISKGTIAYAVALRMERWTA